MINETDRKDMALIFLMMVGVLMGCIAAILPGCDNAAHDAGVDNVKTSTTTSTTTTSTRT